MKRLELFQYIAENMEQARHILRYYDIDYDDDRFQEIIKKTQRDGYTGLVTKLVFSENIKVEDALKLYDEIKDNKLNMAEIQKLTYNEIKDLITNKTNKKDYEFVFDSGGYKVFIVNTYQGALETVSPAWCLKTKSQWDYYTITKGGKQFVAIDKLYISDKEIELTVPNNWDGKTYISDNRESRYGITVYNTLRVDVFNDNNTQYRRFDPELDKIVKDCISYSKKIFGDRVINVKDLDNLIDHLSEILDDMYGVGSFTEIVHSDMDKTIKEFYSKIKEQLNLSKEQLFEKMSEHKDIVLQEDFFVANNGIMDLLINEWLTHDNIVNTIDDYDNVAIGDIHPLGGYTIREQEYDDWIIKYNYGYQYTKYGRAAIIQSFGSLQDYYTKLKEQFVKYYEYDIDINDRKYFKPKQYKDGWIIIANIKDIEKYMDKIITDSGIYEVPHTIKDGKLYIEFYSKK